MLFFLGIYYFLAILYRWVFTPKLQRQFEAIANYCQEFTSVVPITFVLGFYVTFIVGRWWNQYLALPWPDRLAIQISSYVQGGDERGRMIRRALIRYVNQLFVLTFQYTSTVIKARFPTIDHLVEAGIMTVEEKQELESVETPHGIWWVPAQWFGQLAMLARKEGRIHDDLHLKSLIDEMLAFRGQCGTVWSYDWISVPLVYTQVVTIAVYSFFVACLFGRQYLYNPVQSAADSSGPITDMDYYFPFFTVFQFFFYVGWLKVAEAMICPFGKDDDDFEVNWVLDRNLQVGYLIVDRMYKNIPKLTKDAFWDNVEPEIPYTQAAASFRGVPYYGSTQAMNIPERQAEWDFPEPMEPIDEETQIGNTSKVSATAASLRSRNLKKRKSESGDNLSSISQSDSSVDIEDDERSNGSRQADEKRKKTRLGGLMQGFSRSTLFSKFGSKFSINSSRCSMRKNNIARTPPPGSVNRQISIPAAVSNRSRLSTMKVSRASSPQSCENVDELDDTLKNMEEIQLEETGLFPPRMNDNFSLSAAQIGVPPSVKEEPEPDPDNSGSDSNTLPKEKKQKSGSNSTENSTNFMSSQTPLIPPEKN